MYVAVFVADGSEPLSMADFQGIYILTEKVKRVRSTRQALRHPGTGIQCWLRAARSGPQSPGRAVLRRGSLGRGCLRRRWRPTGGSLL